MINNQVGGSGIIIIIIFFMLLLFSSSSIIGLIYYKKSNCKDETSCKDLTTFDEWKQSSDISNTVIFKRNCTNKYKIIKACEDLSSSIITKSINVGNWIGSLDKDLSGSSIRTCTDISFCPFTIRSKVLSSSKFRKYPPGQLIKDDDWSASISGAAYGNGKYTVSVSSWGFATPSGILYNSARGSNDMFHSNSKHNSVTGLPNNDAGSINGIRGEWVAIQLPQKILLKAYRIYPRLLGNFYDSRSPKEFVIFGSNDGTNWTMIDDRRGNNKAPNWTSDPQSFYIDNKIMYDRYMLLATVIGNDNVSISRDFLNIEKIEFFEEI